MKNFKNTRFFLFFSFLCVFLVSAICLLTMFAIYKKITTLEVNANVTFENENIIDNSENNEQILEPTEEPIHTAKIAVVGDLMVHGVQLESTKNKETGEYNFERGFAPVAYDLSSADFTIGNLETTFAGEEASYSDYPMFNTPDSFGYALKNIGFDLLSTANNHSNDKREAGILRTIDTLNSLEIDHIGSYKDKASSEEIYITEVNNIKIAALSYTYGTNGIPLTEGKDYLLNLLEPEKIKEDIKKAKSLSPDIIIVIPHMGNEYESYPKDQFKDWANLMLESGADVVLASHPHVLQPMEIVKVIDEDGSERTCFIAYSLANFISGQRTIPRDTGMILNMLFEKNGTEKAFIKEVSYIPTWVTYRNTSGSYDIRVVAIYDALKSQESGQDFNLRAVDIKRIKEAHKESSETLLGINIPLENIQREYKYYNLGDN